MLTLLCALTIGDAPIHDVATREKRLLCSEHAFVHFYLLLDRIPKYSPKQSLHLCNHFKLDSEISRNCPDWYVTLLVICRRVGYFLLPIGICVGEAPSEFPQRRWLYTG